MKKIDEHKLARMPLGKAAAFVAKETGCPKPALSTLISWATKGVKGVRLDAERFGNRWYSRPASILDFHCKVAIE